MNIQQVSVDKLKAAAYNPRKQLKPGDTESVSYTHLTLPTN